MIGLVKGAAQTDQGVCSEVRPREYVLLAWGVVRPRSGTRAHEFGDCMRIALSCDR